MLKKMISAGLVLMLACGCAGRTESNTASQTITAVPVSPREKEETAVLMTKYGTLTSLAGTIGKAVGEGKWEEVSSLFSAAGKKHHSAKDLKNAFEESGAGSVSFLDGYPVSSSGLSGGYALFEGEDGIYEAVFAVDENYALTDLQFARRNTGAEPESSDLWEETSISAGNAPKVQGILTLPKETEDAPVAVLLPEEMDDAMNESGSNTDFRKDLAHGLAENGIASVRFDMRCHEDPLLLSVFGWDFEKMIGQDFASIVHSLENYPVNASKILYIGHGAGGTLGYAAVYHHFELDGGLVLLNSPYTEDGAHLFQRGAWLEEEAAKEALKAIGEEGEPDQLIYGYPLSWWEKWQSLGALNYTRHVSIPILILQAEEDGAVYFKKDYEDWKSQKGSNVTMKSYPNIGHDLKTKEGVFDDSAAKDIAAWQRGENINSKTAASGGKR